MKLAPYHYFISIFIFIALAIVNIIVTIQYLDQNKAFQETLTKLPIKISSLQQMFPVYYLKLNFLQSDSHSININQKNPYVEEYLKNVNMQTNCIAYGYLSGFLFSYLVCFQLFLQNTSWITVFSFLFGFLIEQLIRMVMCLILARIQLSLYRAQPDFKIQKEIEDFAIDYLRDLFKRGIQSPKQQQKKVNRSDSPLKYLMNQKKMSDKKKSIEDEQKRPNIIQITKVSQEPRIELEEQELVQFEKNAVKDSASDVSGSSLEMEDQTQKSLESAAIQTEKSLQKTETALIDHRHEDHSENEIQLKRGQESSNENQLFQENLAASLFKKKQRNSPLMKFTKNREEEQFEVKVDQEEEEEFEENDIIDFNPTSNDRAMQNIDNITTKERYGINNVKLYRNVGKDNENSKREIYKTSREVIQSNYVKAKKIKVASLHQQKENVTEQDYFDFQLEAPQKAIQTLDLDSKRQSMTQRGRSESVNSGKQSTGSKKKGSKSQENNKKTHPSPYLEFLPKIMKGQQQKKQKPPKQLQPLEQSASQKKSEYNKQMSQKILQIIQVYESNSNKNLANQQQFIQSNQNSKSSFNNAEILKQNNFLND